MFWLPLIYGAKKAAEAAFGSGGGRGRLRCTVYAVPPGNLARFRAEVPDAIDAQDALDRVVAEGDREQARKLNGSIRQLAVANPGCLVLAGNFWRE